MCSDPTAGEEEARFGGIELLSETYEWSCHIMDVSTGKTNLDTQI
jgi:hypothetical protein